jgi:hypothetical protein
MTTTTPAPGRVQLSRRTIVTIAAVSAFALAIALTLWLLLVPAPSQPSTAAPNTAPRPVVGTGQLCAPAPSSHFC